MKINLVMMANMTNEELAVFCRSSSNPLIQELALRLLAATLRYESSEEKRQSQSPRITPEG